MLRAVESTSASLSSVMLGRNWAELMLWWEGNLVCQGFLGLLDQQVHHWARLWCNWLGIPELGGQHVQHWALFRSWE